MRVLVACLVFLSVGCGASRSPQQQVAGAARSTFDAKTARIQWRDRHDGGTGVVEFERLRAQLRLTQESGRVVDYLLLGRDGYARDKGRPYERIGRGDTHPLEALVVEPWLCAGARAVRDSGDGVFHARASAADAAAAAPQRQRAVVRAALTRSLGTRTLQVECDVRGGKLERIRIGIAVASYYDFGAPAPVADYVSPR